MSSFESTKETNFKPVLHRSLSYIHSISLFHNHSDLNHKRYIIRDETRDETDQKRYITRDGIDQKEYKINISLIITPVRNQKKSLKRKYI